MPPISARTTLIQISATAGGTYATISSAHTFTDRRGQQGGQEYFVYGDPTPITEANSDDSTLDVNFLLDLDDTNGQNLLLTAFESGDPLYVRVLYDGTRGRQQPMKVTSYQSTGDANGTGLGKYVAGSVTMTAAGTSTSYTAP
jgi:hypothetical protein